MKDPEIDKGADEFPRRKHKVPRRDWESAVEKQIREAIERGDFDDLPGTGKRLDLRRDPHTPPEWEMAFKLLKDAGFAPDWIEEDKEIRAEREALYRPLRAYARELQQRHTRRPAYETRLIDDFRKTAQELNRKIDLFNLKAPTPRVHRPRIRIDEEIDRFGHLWTNPL